MLEILPLGRTCRLNTNSTPVLYQVERRELGLVVSTLRLVSQLKNKYIDYWKLVNTSDRN